MKKKKSPSSRNREIFSLSTNLTPRMPPAPPKKKKKKKGKNVPFSKNRENLVYQFGVQYKTAT
jgi:hypothetical protein